VHWAATAFGILIVKNQRSSAADQNGKAAAIARRNTVLTTLQEARLIAGFGDWFNPVAISPG
jgi:methylase of polypeptide subunit release factors